MVNFLLRIADYGDVGWTGEGVMSAKPAWHLQPFITVLIAFLTAGTTFLAKVTGGRTHLLLLTVSGYRPSIVGSHSRRERQPPYYLHA